jgi:hypothetical protein
MMADLYHLIPGFTQQYPFKCAYTNCFLGFEKEYVADVLQLLDQNRLVSITYTAGVKTSTRPLMCIK